MTNKLLFFVTILIGSLSFLQAETEEMCDNLIISLEKNKHFCVQKFEENCIFIKPENIIPTEEGLSLDLNGFESVPIPLLHSNYKGCFIQISREEIKTLASKGLCPECNAPTTKNGVCQNPKCFFYQVKVL